MNTKNIATPVLGAIADDFTGATDLAINLVNGGFRVIQLLGVPSSETPQLENFDAVVVALKTRSIPFADAQRESEAALNFLRTQKIERFFFKYCSTFDSTVAGNIGPVTEALLKLLDQDSVLYCPAFPQAGRTVYKGHLFVGDRLLNESGMENHPLNPMHDADLVRFLGKQVADKVGLADYQHLSSVESFAERRAELGINGCRHIIVDTCDDNNLAVIADGCADDQLVTGGSGLARFLPQAYRKRGIAQATESEASIPSVIGRNLVLAGSCSTATLGQVEYMDRRCPHIRIDLSAAVRNAEAETERLLSLVKDESSAPTIMISSTDTAERVNAAQNLHGTERLASAIESVFGSLCRKLVEEQNFRRIVVAGGETSGEVVRSLGVEALQIGAQICTGVPWTETTFKSQGNAIKLALALKSGNFGEENFFESAIGMLNE